MKRISEILMGHREKNLIGSGRWENKHIESLCLRFNLNLSWLE